MANKRLNATITIGGAITSALRSALGSTRDKLGEIGSAIRKLEREQKMLGNSIQTFGRMGKDVDGLRRKYAEVTAEIERTRRAQQRLASAHTGMAAGRQQMASAGLVIGAATAAAATGAYPIVQAAQFEKAMLGVAKQVEGTRDSQGRLTQTYYDMARQVQGLGRELPIATNEIAGMVAAGARMGIARDDLIGFTRTAAMMASAFELPAEELADQMGKIATLFGIPVPKIGELADVINYLDDNAISRGGDIIEVLKRIGGTAQFLKMPERDAAALASTFLTLGSTAEIAGTAANAVMRELSIATMQPKRFQAGLRAIGMDAKQVQRDMARDATGTILRVLDALNKIPAEKRLTVATQLYGKEYGDDVAKLAEGVTEYRRQLGLARSDGAVGSMAREHQARLQTTVAQWEIAKNITTELAVNIGAVLLPTVNQVMGAFGRGAAAVADFVRENQTLVGNLATVGGTVLGTIAVLNGVPMVIGAITFAFNALKLAMLTNPFTAVAVVATTAAVLIWKNWEPLSAWFADLFGKVSDTAGAAVDRVRKLFSGMFDDMKATGEAAIGWLLDKLGAVGKAWDRTRAFFGFGPDAGAGSGARSQGAGPALFTPPALPSVPPMATARATAPAVTNNNTNNISITQQPGQDSRALADEVARRLAERQAVAQRGALFDRARGY